MKIKFLMFLSVFTLLISTICVSVGAYSVVEDATINEQSQIAWGYNMFDKQRFSSTQNLNQYVYLDNNTFTNKIAIEGSYPVMTAIFEFMNGSSGILTENTNISFSYYMYDFIEGNYVSSAIQVPYYYSWFLEDRYFYWDYANFNIGSTSNVDINGLWAFDRYFYWDTLLLEPNSLSSNPYLTFFDNRVLGGSDIPTIEITYNFQVYDYDLHIFEERSYNEIINLSNYVDSFVFPGFEDMVVPLINYPLFEPLFEYANLPTFIIDLEIIIDASEYSSSDTIFSGFNFTLTNEINVDLWSDLIAYTPTSVITEDVDFVTWLVKGVSGVFDTELIPGISMGNILKLILSICLVIAVLRYFVGG